MHLSAEPPPVNGVLLESLVQVLWGESPNAATEVPLPANLPCHKQRTEGEGDAYTHGHTPQGRVHTHNTQR